MISAHAERRRVRRSLLGLTTILASGLIAPALASPHPNLDANGVDLTDGSYNLRLPVASIGSGAATLPLIAYDGKTDNWSFYFVSQSVVGSTRKLTVNLGDRWDNFTLTGSSATSDRGTGATISTAAGGSLTYQSLDGTVIQFGNPVPEPQGGASNLCDDINNGTCTRLALSMTTRNKLKTYFTWKTSGNCSTPSDPDLPPDCTYSWRLSGVRNDAGYSIGWSYASSSVAVHQNPGPTWYQRTGATLANNGTAVASVGYGNPTTNVYTITTPGGKVWTITGSSSAITGIRRPSAASNTTTIAYTGGAVSSVTKDGVTTTYSRSVSGSTATETATDAQAHATVVISDMNLYRPTSVKDALNRTTAYGYDAVGRLKSVSYPEGNSVQYTYDTRGNLIETRLKAKPSVGGTDIVTSANYPTTCIDATCNEPTWTKDANGNQTDYGYDTTTGLVTSVKRPAPTSGANRPETRYAYSAVSGASMVTGISTCRTGIAPACVGTADETKRTIGYDANLRATSMTISAGDGSVSSSVAVAYDPAGNATGVDGPLAGTGDTTSYVYSADRELLGRISADPDGGGALNRRAQRLTYNNDGLRTKVEVGTATAGDSSALAAMTVLQTLVTGYDTNARKVSDTVSAAGTIYGVTHYNYDNVGRPLCTAVRMNSGAWGTLTDACTLQTTGTFGADRIRRATYDAAGEQTVVTTAYGTADASDDVTTGYSNNGKVQSIKDAEGNLTTYSYDGFDRLLKTNYPVTTVGSNASNAGDYEQLGYDPNGNVTSRRLRDGQSIGFSYDTLNRVKTKDLPGIEPDVTFGYDLQDRPLSMATSSQTLTFGYDALGRLLTQSGPLGTMTNTFDTASRRIKLQWSDGFYVNYDYDAVGEMTTVRENGATTGVGVLATYAYNDLGARTSITRGNGVTSTLGYDALARLSSLTHDLAGTTSDVTTTYSYNPASQVTSVTRNNDSYAWMSSVNTNSTYTRNGLNQYSQAGSAPLSYDTRGNTTAIGSSSYTYVSENLLVTGPNATLGYDPVNRLFQLTSGATVTRFGYDQTDLVGEYNNANALQRRYVFGAGNDAPVVWYEGTGTTDRRWLVADERGSIVVVTDGLATILRVNSYDEYGAPSSNNLGRFQYTGQAYLSELGLNYYKSRVYSPSISRFLQTDPVGYGAGVNWYNYASSDPVNRVDFTGLDDDIVVIGKCNFICRIARAINHLFGGDGGGDGSSGNNNAKPGGGSFSGGGGSGGGGGATGGWGAVRNSPDSADKPADQSDIVVVGVRPPSADSSNDTTVVTAQPNTVYFGYPPDQNSEHHVDRHLNDALLNAQQKKAIKSKIAEDINTKYPNLRPGQAAIDFVVFGNQQYEYRAYGLPGDITNVGTVFSVDD